MKFQGKGVTKEDSAEKSKDDSVLQNIIIGTAIQH